MANGHQSPELFASFEDCNQLNPADNDGKCEKPSHYKENNITIPRLECQAEKNKASGKGKTVLYF
jgi:hypothetical protein